MACEKRKSCINRGATRRCEGEFQNSCSLYATTEAAAKIQRGILDVEGADVSGSVYQAGDDGDLE